MTNVFIPDTPYHAEFYIGHNQPVIPIEVEDVHGLWRTHYFLFDSGNDRTIISRNTAQSLGFNPDEGAEIIVGGVVKGVTKTAKLRLGARMKIGNCLPIKLDLMMMDTDVNLLGREVVFRGFDIILSNDGKLIFVQGNTDFSSDFNISA